jgi:hypothetical protein
MQRRRIHLVPLADVLFGGNDQWILQQDNARCHVSRLTMNHLRNINVRVLPWPANSPDMNCIENLWASLKRRIGDRRCGDSRQEVIEIALDIWHNDNDFRELCLKLIQSMPKRVQTLYKAHGSQTKY